MPEEKHVNTEGWHVVLAVIVLLALVGYLYYQAKQNPQTQTGTKRDPLEVFGIPRASRSVSPSAPLP